MKGEREVIMKPSIKTIETRLMENLKKEYTDVRYAARLIRWAMDESRNPDVALDKINYFLKGYGVETIKDNGWDRYYMDICLLYVNMGDTYIPTVIYDTRKDSWYVCSLGDIVERNEKRFNV